MGSTGKKPEQKTLKPGEALRLLEQHARATQDALASRTDIGEDVLHYLAENGERATRQAVAANPAASPKSNLLLANDAEEDIRLALARKIGRLFPGLLAIEQKSLRDLTLQTLEKLANDEVTAVRAMLAEEIKHHDCVPKKVIKNLARDVEPSVSLPIIEFSPQLSDRDLIELVAATRASSVLSAVARRKRVSEDVSDAVATTLDIGAVATLLANADASIRARTLDRIISNAAEVAEWQGPLVVRPDLSKTGIKRLASFVASALIDQLLSRAGLDDGTKKHLKKKLDERRVQEGDPDAANAAHAAGALDEAFVAEAVENCRKETVVRALSLLAKADEDVVRRVIDAKSAKAATALVWRAGLSMRVAFKLQTQVMRLPGNQMVHARRGTDFPMTDDEMTWHLGYFGIA